MPIKFSEIQALPDLLAADRFSAYFPILPGGGNGKELTLRNCEITLPPYEVAQILVKIMGWSINFAGRRIQQNSMTMGFYEDRLGTAHNILLSWQQEAADFIQAGGQLKRGYAVEVDIQVYDTMGKTALLFRANNVWPMRVTTPTLQDETSTLARIEVDLSVDSVDYVAVTDVSAGRVYTDLPGLTGKAHAAGYRVSPAAEMPFKNIQVPNQLGLSVRHSQSLMNSFMQMDVAAQLNRARGNVMNNILDNLGIR